MAEIPLTFAGIGDVGRRVGVGDFHPRMDGDAVFVRPEPLPRFSTPDLFFDRGEDIDRAEMMSYLRMEGRRDTFVAHLADAVVVPDVLAVVAGGNRFPFPNTYCEDSRTQAVEYYFDRSAALYSIEKCGPHGVHEWDYFLAPPNDMPTYRVQEPHIFLANQSAINYWHFVTEIMPRTWIYDVWPELRELPVIVQRKGNAFEAALSMAIGVSTSRIFALDTKALYRFDHLIFPSALCDRALTPAKAAYVRAKLAAGVPVPAPLTPAVRAAAPGGRKRRLYLSRADRGARRILNEADLLALLVRYGFEAVNPGSLSIPEQAALFAEAEMVIGPHGAALTNMLFLPQGAVVLELAARPWGPLFFGLASACGLHYMALGSQWDFYPANRHRKRERRNPAAMVFDPVQLAQVVETGLARLDSNAIAGL